MKTIKTIKIDTDKCTGCRSCEAACSAFHADPKYAIANPKRSRIRVWWNEENALFVPVLAGQYTDAECNARFSMVINGKEYSECILCRASCPSRKLFIEPDADIPLKCDACGTPSPAQGPLCVNVCLAKALTCVERQVDNDE